MQIMRISLSTSGADAGYLAIGKLSGNTGRHPRLGHQLCHIPWEGRARCCKTICRPIIASGA